MNAMLFSRQRHSNKVRFVAFINSLFPAFFAVGMLFVLIPVITYARFASDLTSKERIMNRNNEGVILYDRHDQPFFTFYEAKQKTFIPIDKIPDHVEQAVIAIEDKDFYTHPGFSIRGISRSLLANWQNNDIVSGGSTITQQLVKNSLLSPKKSYLRKYQEIVLAEEIERRYSKREILEMYLNSVYFGEGAFGIEEAAQAYFGKSATKLTLAESTLLAGILPAPSIYSPLIDKNAAKERQRLVLTTMIEQNYLTPQQQEAVIKSELNYKSSQERLNVIAPHFAIMVRNQLIEKYGEEQIARAGLKVKTTIDLKKQEVAEKIVKDHVDSLAGNRVTNGSAVGIDPRSGEILIMVGSKDWYDGKFGKVNVATTPRQPGSAFKPIVYAYALENQLITPATLLRDEPTVFEGNYKPVDYDRRYRGKVFPRRALANSLNIPAVDVMSRVGVPAVLDWSKELGITTLKDPVNYGLSLTLGTGETKLVELTGAYGTFANEGKHTNPYAIKEIQDKRGKVIYNHTPNQEQILDRRVAFLVSSFLSDNNARAEQFGSVLNISRPAAVKTGTTDDYKDSLTIGYTPSLAVGVWVGNNDGTPMDNVAGSLGAAPIWKSLMEALLAGTPVEEFSPPNGLVQASVCYRYTVKLASNDEKDKDKTETKTVQHREYFLAGTEPPNVCSAIQTVSSNEDRNTPPAQPSATTAPEPTTTPSPTIVPPTTTPTSTEIFIENNEKNKDKD